MLIPQYIYNNIYTYSVSVGIVSVQVQCAGHEIIIGFLHTHKHKHIYICTYIYVNLPPTSPLKAIIRIVMDRYSYAYGHKQHCPPQDRAHENPPSSSTYALGVLSPASFPPPCRSKLAPCRSKLAHMCISMNPSRPLSS